MYLSNTRVLLLQIFVPSRPIHNLSTVLGLTRPDNTTLKSYKNNERDMATEKGITLYVNPNYDGNPVTLDVGTYRLGALLQKE